MARILVIGAGLAGLSTALMAHESGHSVTVVSRGVGGSALSVGALGILGQEVVHSEQQTTSRLFHTLTEFIAAHPDHPYTSIGQEAIFSGCEWLVERSGLFAKPEPRHMLSNSLFPTAIGGVRSSAYVPRSMAASALRNGQRYLVVGISSIKDFPAQLIADNLSRCPYVHVKARAVVVNLAARGRETDSTPTNFARALDRHTTHNVSLAHKLIAQIKKHLHPGETVLLPAVLGLDPRTHTLIEAELGAPIGEIPLPPPSIPGRRINDWLINACHEARIDVHVNATALSAVITSGRVTAVKIQRAGHVIFEQADHVVLATGGFESGGLTRDSYGTIRETVCDLPIHTPTIANPDFEAEAIFRSGVAVNSRMMPLTHSGQTVATNLSCVGSIIGGSIPWVEHSGEGIALGSAWACSRAITMSSCHENQGSTVTNNLHSELENAATKAGISAAENPPESTSENAGEAVARMSLDSCVKCTICESYCPVMRSTEKFAGPKFVGPQAERFRMGASVDRSLDYCSGCSICTTVCPQGVKIAEINARARAVMKANHMPLRDRIITQTELEGKLLSPVAPIANAALASKPLRKIVEKVVGVHAQAPVPKAQMHSFMSWMKKHEKQRAAQERAPKQVIFFHGCAGGYFEVATSIATVEVLEYLGFEVIVPKQGCCGLAQQSNGLFTQATAKVRRLAAQLNAASAEANIPIVTSSGSCAGMLRHEARNIMDVDDEIVTAVGARVVETSEFLLSLIDSGEFPLEDLQPCTLTIPYHQPCQVKSQGIGKPAIRLMESIPGVTVVESGQPCCGIAGTYGLKKEKYEVAQKVGAPLFAMVRATNSKLAACETETCRWQIRKGSGAEVIHPVQLIHYALGLAGAHAAWD